MAFKLQIAGVDALSQQQHVTDVVIERNLYEHTRAQVTLRWQEHTRYNERQTAHLAAQVLNCPVDVAWKDNDLVEHVPCFHGYIEQARALRDATSSRLVLSCVAYSKRTDLLPRHRTFQATTLLDIAQHIAGREPLVKIANTGDLAKVPIVLSVQYAETDFAYLSRMLHAWSVPMSVNDQTGEVILGARGAEPKEPFPDAGYGWTEVAFQGALKALPQISSGGGGLPGAVRGQVGQFIGQLARTAADYHAIPEAPMIGGNVSGNAAQTDTSGYRLVLEGAVLPFSPGEVVGFEGQGHLIRQVKITGHPEQTTATQTFALQPLTLPIAPERKSPRWPSKSVWGWVVANEHDPLQQGRIQVEFDWEEMDPQASGDRAWLHMLTPYGGGSGSGKKAGAYSGFYSVPEVGERVLVEFVGEWDSEAVVIGVVRQSSQGATNNPKHTKRWSTPSGNEVTMHTKGGVDVLRLKSQGKLAFESQVASGRSSLTLSCGGNPEDTIHFENSGGSTRLDISARTDIYIQAGNHVEIEGHSVVIRATGPGGVQVQSMTSGVGVQAETDVGLQTKKGAIGLQAKTDVGVQAIDGGVGINGKAGISVAATAGGVGIQGKADVTVDGANIHLNGG